jgi:hypothetical protein
MKTEENPFETLNAAYEWLADQIEDAGREIESSVRHFGEAMLDFERRTQEPSERIARAAEQIAREARRTFERLACEPYEPDEPKRRSRVWL